MSKIGLRAAGACLTVYALLGANFAFAGYVAPAPLFGAIGGPVGIVAAGAALGGYLLFKRLRDRD